MTPATEGRFENGFFVQGDLRFKIDPNDAHKTFDAVAALSKADKIKLAQLNGITTEPFNNTHLTTILKSVAQNVFIANKEGTVPAAVLAGHQGRLHRYNAEITIPYSDIDLLSRKVRKSSTRSAPSLLFVVDEKKYESDWQNWRSQRYLVIKTLIDLGATVVSQKGVSMKAVQEAMKETRETTKPKTNPMGQIVRALEEAKIVVCLNPQDRRERKKKDEAPAKAPAPAPQQKQGNYGVKKKH